VKRHRAAFDEGYLLRITPESRPPFQGDFLSVSLPRPKGPTPQSLRRGRSIGRSGTKMQARRSVAKAALGYSLFALRATAKCPYSRARTRRCGCGRDRVRRSLRPASLLDKISSGYAKFPIRNYNFLSLLLCCVRRMFERN
jgi:hypothetical protein